MSLKSFHLFFIFLATLFCLGFAAWTFWGNTEGFGRSIKLFGGVSGAAGLALFGYGIWFAVIKSRKIIV